MTAGTIPSSMPSIKAVAMDICSNDYNSLDSALAGIRETLNDHYRGTADSQLIARAVTGLQDAYRTNIFPYMKVKWSAYPNNIGHLEFDGCFRCHNDTHQNEAGSVISKDCNLCHEIIQQGPVASLQNAVTGQSLTFIHPEDIGDAWRESLCTECHTGLNP